MLDETIKESLTFDDLLLVPSVPCFASGCEHIHILTKNISFEHSNVPPPWIR